MQNPGLKRFVRVNSGTTITRPSSIFNILPELPAPLSIHYPNHSPIHPSPSLTTSPLSPQPTNRPIHPNYLTAYPSINSPIHSSTYSPIHTSHPTLPAPCPCPSPPWRSSVFSDPIHVKSAVNGGYRTCCTIAQTDGLREVMGGGGTDVWPHRTHTHIHTQALEEDVE